MTGQGFSIWLCPNRLGDCYNIALSDVSLSNSAQINVLAGGGGSIAITARNLALSEGSSLRAGINDGLGFAGAQAGDIQLDVTEAINLADGSRIRTEVGLGGTGNSNTLPWEYYQRRLVLVGTFASERGL